MFSTGFIGRSDEPVDQWTLSYGAVKTLMGLWTAAHLSGITRFRATDPERILGLSPHVHVLVEMNRKCANISVYSDMISHALRHEFLFLFLQAMVFNAAEMMELISYMYEVIPQIPFSF